MRGYRGSSRRACGRLSVGGGTGDGTARDCGSDLVELGGERPMKSNGWVALGIGAIITACSSGPTSPTAAKPATFGTESTVSTAAVTTDRVRLRRVGGGDIQTGLTNGQVIAVPLNVKIDIWAEIARLEADRARLVVDWGNGNSDFTGCGSCRLENTYTSTGRHTLSVKILDLNAVAGAPPVTSITVTIEVVDPTAVQLSCAPATLDFEASSFIAPGVSISGASSYLAGPIDPEFNPEIVGIYYGQGGGGVTTITFDTDKNALRMGFGAVSATPFTYQVFDAAGAVVAAGSATPLIPAPSFAGQVKDTLAFTTSTPFRTIVITSTVAVGYDNIVGSCQ
jgi:hypothetical protein